MWISANGLSFYAERKGNGVPLLFLGGSAWDLRLPPTPLGTELTANFDVALFDQRGVGQSDKPAGPYTMEDYARDAVSIMDDLQWETAHIVGYSFGGMVAQEFAVRWPERVNKLVLAATSPGGREHASYPIEEFLSLSPYERAKKSLQVGNTLYGSAFQARDPDAFEALVQKRMKRQAAFMDSEEAKEGYRNQLGARATHDTCERLHQIVARTLILSGESDGQASKSGQMFMRENISGSVHRTVSGGHNFIFENDQAIHAIIEFLHK